MCMAKALSRPACRPCISRGPPHRNWGDAAMRKGRQQRGAPHVRFTRKTSSSRWHMSRCRAAFPSAQDLIGPPTTREKSIRILQGGAYVVCCTRRLNEKCLCHILLDCWGLLRRMLEEFPVPRRRRGQGKSVSRCRPVDGTWRGTWSHLLSERGRAEGGEKVRKVGRSEGEREWRFWCGSSTSC